MDNHVKNPRRSISLGGGGYRSEELNKIILQTQNQTDLLVFYIDYIRNYKELTEEMMENIKRFDDNSKMLLIKEYNIVIKSVNSLLG
jgi:GTPase Era involved in 16S rRNA processing